jgi:hypothetical protein
MSGKEKQNKDEGEDTQADKEKVKKLGEEIEMAKVLGGKHVSWAPPRGLTLWLKGPQGWVQCEDHLSLVHLPYYKDNANDILLDSTTARLARAERRKSILRTSAERRPGSIGPARVGLLGLQCSARALFRTVSFKIK